jgi:hypothetical protein
MHGAGEFLMEQKTIIRMKGVAVPGGSEEFMLRIWGVWGYVEELQRWEKAFVGKLWYFMRKSSGVMSLKKH